MSSNILTNIPNVSSITQHTVNSSANNRQVEGNTAQNIATQKNISTGNVSNQAAIVSLSSEAKARAASYGEGRNVDATFEKEEEKSEGKEEGKEKKEGKSSVVSVEA
ncbi:MAG: hypothetical protein KBC84_10165 [Proteobacteria bacterium]|nr:hypothetical protein [Pseudomonadota bacterium]